MSTKRTPSIKQLQHMGAKAGRKIAEAAAKIMPATTAIGEQMGAANAKQIYLDALTPTLNTTLAEAAEEWRFLGLSDVAVKIIQDAARVAFTKWIGELLLRG